MLNTRISFVILCFSLLGLAPFSQSSSSDEEQGFDHCPVTTSSSSGSKLDLNESMSPSPTSIEEHIRRLGYPVEVHQITTEDGYILTYHRIPHGKTRPDPDVVRMPVLLQHGILACSSTWVVQRDGLGYLLAEAGFDLWMGNSRGNMYSRKHNKYDPDSDFDKSKFWSFSWHELGYYDLPASIDYILEVTGHSQLYYVGHSMGTTMFFVLGATRPEYMAKVKAAVLMAPVVFPYHIHGLSNIFTHQPPIFYTILKAFNIYELLPFSKGIFQLDEILCSNSLQLSLCKYVLNGFLGFDNPKVDQKTLRMALNYLPAGTTVKQIQHFGQISKKGNGFRRFDYGLVGNLWRYCSPVPPTYDLTNVKVPLYLHFAQNDFLAVPEDVEYLVPKLGPNVKEVRKVPHFEFNHMDFIWATDAKNLVYDDIIKTLTTLSSDDSLNK